jgi:gamma-glutamylcyclotransferase (GGCT)/AIG2-like uncharacterized protein YtfP
MANLIRVFVYGTLKRGEPNHQLLTKKENGFAEFQSEGRTAEKFPLVIGEMNDEITTEVENFPLLLRNQIAHLA